MSVQHEYHYSKYFEQSKSDTNVTNKAAQILLLIKSPNPTTIEQIPRFYMMMQAYSFNLSEPSFQLVRGSPELSNFSLIMTPIVTILTSSHYDSETKTFVTPGHMTLTLNSRKNKIIHFAFLMEKSVGGRRLLLHVGK